MTYPAPIASSSHQHERTLDELKMKNSSTEHDDGKILRYLIENKEELIKEGIRRYDAITK